MQRETEEVQTLTALVDLTTLRRHDGKMKRKMKRRKLRNTEKYSNIPSGPNKQPYHFVCVGVCMRA